MNDAASSRRTEGMKVTMWKFNSIARIGFLICWYTLASAALLAQSGEGDVGEVAAFAGGSFGIGSHPVVGASAGTAFSRYGMVLIETSFVPLGSQTVRVVPGAPAAESSHLYHFSLSTHIRVPVRERWAPYGILGVGAIWNTYRRSVVNSQGVAVVSHYGDFDFAFHTGGGVRYYIGENWGIRPEVKLIVSRQTYTQFSVGFFATLPTSWP